jgi:hypothetical protein
MLEEKDLEMIKQMIVSTLSAVAEKPKKPRKPYKKRVKTTSKVDKPSKRVIIQEPVKVLPNQPRIRKMGRGTGTVETVRGKHGNQCRTESFQPVDNRPNDFLKMAEAKMFKNDTIIDKKLSGKNVPVPRRLETELWDVDCQKCGRSSIVSPSMVMQDPDTHEILFTCDDCIRR